MLIGTFKTLRDNPELAELIDEVADMADPIDLDLVRAFQASTLAQPVLDEFFRTVVAEGARLPVSIWRAALKEIAAYDDFAELSQIAAPTILFWGERDNFSTYEQQQELASEIRRRRAAGSMPAPATACTGRNRGASPPISPISCGRWSGSAPSAIRSRAG